MFIRQPGSTFAPPRPDRVPLDGPHGPTQAPPEGPAEKVTLDKGDDSKLYSKAAFSAISSESLLGGSVAGFGGAAALGAAGVMGLGLNPMLMAGSLMGVAGVACGAIAGMGIGIGAALGSLKSFKAEEKPAAEEPKTELPTRNADGRFRTKNGSTHLETLRDTYGEGFAAGLPGNMPLQVLRAATGLSLTKMVHDPESVDAVTTQLKDWKPSDEVESTERTRNADGRFRQKRGDTHIDTLRKAYGLDFAAQLPGNFPLAVLRKLTGKSLSHMVEHPETQKVF